MSAPEAPSQSTSLLQAICRTAALAGSSDVHIKAGAPPFQRINGQLMVMPRMNALDKESTAKMAWEIMTKGQR